MSRHGKVQQCKAELGFKLLNKVARFFKMSTKHSIVETLTFLAIMAALYIVWCQKSITYSHLLLFIVRFELKLQCVHPKDCSLTLIWKIGFWWAMAFGSSVMILSIQSYLLLMKRKWTLGRFFGLWYLGARKHTPELHIHSLNKLWRFRCRFTAPYRLMLDKSLSFQRRDYIQCGFAFYVPRESEQLYKFQDFIPRSLAWSDSSSKVPSASSSQKSRIIRLLTGHFLNDWEDCLCSIWY